MQTGTISPLNSMNLRTYMDYEGGFPSFVRTEVIRNMDDIEMRLSHFELLCSNTKSSVASVFRELRIIENERKRSYNNSDYRARYGMELICLLPHGNLSNKDKVRLISKFTESIMGQEKLLYFAYENFVGLATYVHIYFTDREYLPYRAEYYSRDYYQDKDTKKMVKKGTKNSVLVAKEGDIKGYTTPGFSKTKSGTFTFKTHKANEFREKFHNFWKQALIFVGTIAKGIVYFKRKKVHEPATRFIKRIIRGQNQLMAYIENVLNSYAEEVYYSAYRTYRDGSGGNQRIETKRNRQIMEVYHHYRNRFKNNLFHDKGKEYRLFGRVDVSEENLELLRKVFDQEVKEKFESEDPN